MTKSSGTILDGESRPEGRGAGTAPRNETSASHTSERYWDGVRRSYIPPVELQIAPCLKLHRGEAADIDPISFEVIRYALLNANFEHSRLIQRLTVSPVVMVARDMQSSILTETADLVFLGPNVQYFANSQSLSTKWTLENRAESPGIAPGDMFLSNDPFVGSAHHQDTALMLPLFLGDELYCWIVNTLHYADVGGTSPGSFCIGARDAWGDPPPFPPIKLVEQGKIRRDVEELFIRQSRLPTQVLMDLRAAVTANQLTGRRVLDLVRRYGPDTVKAVMRRVIGSSEELFRKRLSLIPDGRWSARGYVESSVPEDEGIYCYQINLEKRDGRLVVDNEGTDPQAGAINCTFAPFSGAFLTSVVQALVPELAGGFGGAYRCVEFKPTSGLLNCAEHPAAVSPSGAATSEMAINLSVHVISRMLACGDDSVRERIIGAPQPAFYAHVYAGLNAAREPFVHPNSDNMIGSQGGSASSDGVDAGGAFWMPGAIAENVEQVESHYPLLYLYRRFLPGGHDGAGRHRGGLGMEVCSMPWNAQHFEIALATNESCTHANGVLGGNPGSRAGTRVFSATDLQAQMRNGRLPLNAEQWTGKEVYVRPKALGIVVNADGLIAWTGATTAGFGDPFLRDPEDCRRDCLMGLFTPESVREVYGVVLVGQGHDCKVDLSQTQLLRERMQRDRLQAHIGGRQSVPEGAHRCGEVLALHGETWICGVCAHGLGPKHQNYKAGTRMHREPIDSFAPGFDTPHRPLADLMEFRAFYCPNCGTRFDTELARREAALLHDISLA